MKRRKTPSRSPPRSHRRGFSPPPPPRRWTVSSSSSTSSFGSISGGRGGFRGRRAFRGSGNSGWNTRSRARSGGRGNGGRGRGFAVDAYHTSNHATFSSPTPPSTAAPVPPSSSSSEFTILKVSGIRRGLSGDVVKASLRREFRSYDYKASVVDEGRDQTAYLFFDSAVQAETALAAHPRVCFSSTSGDDGDSVSLAVVEVIPRNHHNQHQRHFDHARPSSASSSSRRRLSNGHEAISSFYPDYLRHVPPEDDPLASRTLFIGNLDVTVTHGDLDAIFSRFGTIKDIDIKRPQPGQGNAFAFIRFENLDMAHRAKLEMSGQYVGKYVCKIGYGKPNATSKIWIGGLGPWASEDMLEREFDRFGAIRTLTYRGPGASYAYVEYDTVDAATAAVEKMRGYPLGGADKRVRVDYVDLDAGVILENGHGRPRSRSPRELSSSPPRRNGKHCPSSPHSPPSQETTTSADFLMPPRTPPSPPPPTPRERHHLYHPQPPHHHRHQSPSCSSSFPAPIPDPEPALSASPPPCLALDQPHVHKRHTGPAVNITDAAHANPSTWRGGVILKTSIFATQMHHLEGDPGLVAAFASNAQRSLRVNQRLRLDPAKLMDIERSLVSRPSYAIYLALPTSTTGLAALLDNGGLQVRPFKSLVVYLKSKSAAGIVVHNGTSQVAGLVYVFPPCDFTARLLARQCPPIDCNANDPVHGDNYLVIVATADSPRPEN